METNNQNLSPQPLPPAPAPKKWHLHKGLIAMVILAVLAAAAVWVYFANQPDQNITPVVINHKSNNNPSTPASIPVIATSTGATASNTPTSEETTNWQTYTNNAMGVTLKFPKEWHIQYAPAPGGDFSLSTEQIPSWASSTAPQNQLDFRVSLRAYQNTLPIDQWYDQYFSNQPLKGITSKNDTTLAGLPSIKVETVNNYTGTFVSSQVHYFVGKGGHVFDVSFDYNDPTYLPTYQTILTTISFFNLQIPNGNYSVSTKNIFPSQVSATDITQANWDHSTNYITQPGGNVTGGETLFIAPDQTQFPISQSVTQQIGYITGMEGDTQNQNILFISGNSDPNESDISTCTNSLYTYNLQTGDLVQFYTEVSKNNSPMNPQSCRLLRIEGIQGSKLVILIDDPNNSPGPCTDYWSDYSDQYLYIDLANIEKGLQDFSVPQDLIDQGQIQEQQCQESL